MNREIGLATEAQAAFFSYNHDDSEFALRLAEDLKAAGAAVWMDQLDLVGGERWAEAVQEALEKCPRVLVILSPSSVSSPHVMDEVTFAFDDKKTVIPVFHRDCKIPLQLRSLHHIDFRTDYARGMKALLKALGVEQPPERSIPAPSTVPPESQTILSDADAEEQARLHEEHKQTAERVRLKAIVFSAAAVVLLFLGFVTWKKLGGTPPGGGKAGLGDRHTTILRLSGSNTLGASLGPSLAEAFLKNQGFTDIRVLPGANRDEKIVQGTLPGDTSVSVITISARGSATAFIDLADNNCDIGMASRRIMPDEATKLSSLGDMYSGASEHLLGVGGIAVIVNAANRVNALEVDQIMEIFSGGLSDWSQVSASHGAINVYARDESASWDTFKNFVLDGKALAPGARRFKDSMALSEAVAHDPKSIGFVSFPYVGSVKAIAVAERGAPAIQPTQTSVATGAYPLSLPLFLYTPANPRNLFTRKFVEFALSKEGQNVVRDSGFVPRGELPVAGMSIHLDFMERGEYHNALHTALSRPCLYPQNFRYGVISKTTPSS